MNDTTAAAPQSESPPGIPKPQSLLEEDEPTLTQDLTQEPDEDDEDNHEQSSHAKRCLLDFVEWWCYKLISATTTSEIKTAEAELLKAMGHFGSSQWQCDFGRLANRINIAAFSLDVALLGSSANTSTAATLSSSAASAPINNIIISLDQHWNMIGEELILLKSKLLRKDANADTALLTSEEERQALVNAIPSPQKEKSSKFQKHYQHAALLVKVQTALSIFHKKLTNQLQPEQTELQEGESNNHTSTQTQSKKKAVREAIEEYETQINQLFTTTTKANKDEEKEEDEDNDNENDNASVSSSDVRELPQELAGFLLKDLYQSSKNQTISDSASTSSSSSNNNNNSNPNSTTTALAERLLKHVNSILKGTGQYSQATCQKTIRKLLKEWHDSVLEQPTLVALGYGSSASSKATPQQNRAIAEEDALLRRLSNCGNTNNNIDHDVSHLQGYLSDSDVDEHQQQQQQEQQKRRDNHHKKKKSSSKAAAVAKKNKFVPIKWVDSDEEDDDTIWDPQQQQQQQPVSSSRSTSPSPSPTPPHRNNKKRAIDKLYSDSEEDPEESIITISSTSPSPSPPPPPPPPRPSSSRGRAADRRRTTRSRSRSRSPTNHRGRSSRDDLKNKSSGSSSFKRSSSPPPPQQRCSRNRSKSNNSSRRKREAIKREQEEERSNRRMPVKLSRREKGAILDGVKLYGVGRWTIVQKRAPGRVLDKLSVQTIKAAYEQIMTMTKQQQQRLKRQRDSEEEEEQEHQQEEKRRKKYHHQHHQHSKEQNKHQQHHKKQQQRSHCNSSKNKGTTTHMNRRR